MADYEWTWPSKIERDIIERALTLDFLHEARNLVLVGRNEVKSPYLHAGGNPNRVTQSLIAVLVGLQVPFLCTETHELGEEMVASYLYQVHLYHWLETNDYGRFLVDNDL
jgi:hypothetical protein